MAILNKKSKVSDEIPSASMADIAFLLLVFFLVTTTFPKDKGLAVVLPESEVEVEVSQRNVLHITVQPDGTVLLRRGESENISTITAREVEQIWRTEVAQNPNLIAAVKTHPDAAHRYMIAVLDALQLAGAERVSLQILEEG
ncbi:MAG: biopolymer transporter ExbD [Gemmatimonadota bacterium]